MHIIYISAQIYLCRLYIYTDRLSWYNTGKGGKGPFFTRPCHKKGGSTMAVSKAQQAAVNKYMKANYDRINLTVPKGKKDLVQSHAEARGESVNGFINRAINETMERDSGGFAPAGNMGG
jgi:hypothetical protein